MITFGKTTTKPNFLFGKLPHFFKQNDTYVPNLIAGYENDGLLERYLEIFCIEVDDEVASHMGDLIDITDAEALPGLTRDNPTELVQHIAELFGNPPDVGTTDTFAGGPDPEPEYLALIGHIRQILQTKGTIKALELYLSLYGYEIDTLTEASASETIYDATPTVLKYDDSLQYDAGLSFFSEYSLVITDKPGTGTKSPTTTWLDDYLKPAIQTFLSPIWATLDSLTYV